MRSHPSGWPPLCRNIGLFLSLLVPWRQRGKEVTPKRLATSLWDHWFDPHSPKNRTKNNRYESKRKKPILIINDYRQKRKSTYQSKVEPTEDLVAFTKTIQNLPSTTGSYDISNNVCLLTSCILLYHHFSRHYTRYHTTCKDLCTGYLL